MKRLTLSALIGDCVHLMTHGGAATILPFFALGAGVELMNFMLFPDLFRAALSGTASYGLADVLTDPGLLMEETAFALLFSIQFLRLWHRNGLHTLQTGSGPVIGPLIVLNLIAAMAVYTGLYFFVLPGILLLAATSLLIPVILLERPGWSAMPRALALAGSGIGALTGAWFLLLLPVFSFIWSQNLAADAPLIAILWSVLFGNAVGALVSAGSLCLAISAYWRLANPGQRDLEDIFR